MKIPQLIPVCPVCGKSPKLSEVGKSMGLPSQYKFFCGTHCSVGDWFPTKELALADWIIRAKTRRGEVDEDIPSDEEKLSGILFAIKSYFPDICGKERTREAVDVLRSMQAELKEYHSFGSTQELATVFAKGRAINGMSSAEAIKIIQNNNRLLARQMAELSAAAVHVPGTDTKAAYSTLDSCQKEYEACLLAIAALQGHQMRHDVADMSVAQPLDDWNEDDGSVLWWKFPIVEPPYCGTPLDENFPAYVTHWTRFICPDTVKTPSGQTQ